MALSVGSRIGPYEILATLGAGGMGQVYRAKDTRLGRIVAVKAMHEAFAQDPERVARFQREAQLLASLNHPNIAAIHGVEELDGSRFLILEFVDGRPLSDILQAGAPSFADAMAIARQIAGALATAHERGIIHRDLKPGNVMVTPDGQVKVLDFGLGKAIEGDRSHTGDTGGPPANSPTMTMAATQAGIILGTAGYMSPEQAKGRVADKRSDVWAFGCVLFELLTGKRAFDGEDVTEILAAIVRGEPEWQALPAGVPEPVRDLVRRCLIRNRTERIGDMSVVQFLLNERASGAMPVASAPAGRGGRSIGLPSAAGLVAAAVVITAAVLTLWPRADAPAAARLARLSITLPEGDLASLNMAPVAVSPDGSSVVYVAWRDNKTQLFLRDLAELTARPLQGTEGARSPFFSPNGQWIGFFAQGKLKKITVGGTALQDLAAAPDARGGTWSADDVIYFAPTNVSSIWKVPAGGGGGTEFIPLDRAKGEVSLRWPHVLPGGRSVLFSVWAGPGLDEAQIVEQSLTSNERHALIKGGSTPRFVSPGFLTYGRLDQLFAVPWRPGQRDLSGVVPVTLPETPRLENEGSSSYAVSDDGTLVYVAGDPARLAQKLVWVDRTGKAESLPLKEREFESVNISPDGQQAVVQIQDAVIGLWMYDFARQSLTPFLTTGASSQAPVWSHDGRRIVYRGTRTGFRNLFMKSADGTGTEVRLTNKESVIHTPTSVSPDGQWVLFNESGFSVNGGVSIWRVRLGGEGKPEPLLQNGESTGIVSPDGKWLAFMGAPDPQLEVFVQPYPGPGPRRQISVGGGAFPRWSRDGREIFYDTLDFNRMMAVTITSTPSLSVSTPHVVFEGRYRTSINANTPYDVSLDGRRFLRVQRVQPDFPIRRIDVVLNWFSELTNAGQRSEVRGQR